MSRLMGELEQETLRDVAGQAGQDFEENRGFIVVVVELEALECGS